MVQRAGIGEIFKPEPGAGTGNEIRRKIGQQEKGRDYIINKKKVPILFIDI